MMLGECSGSLESHGWVLRIAEIHWEVGMVSDFAKIKLEVAGG